MTTAQHVLFDDRQLALLRRPMLYPRVVEQQDEATQKEGTSKRNIDVFEDTFTKETSETKDGKVSDESCTEVDERDAASGERTNAPFRRSALVCKEPNWISSNAMPRSFTAGDISLKDGLEKKDQEACIKGIKNESHYSRRNRVLGSS